MCCTRGILLRAPGNTLPIILRLGARVRITRYLNSPVALVNAVTDKRNGSGEAQREKRPQ